MLLRAKCLATNAAGPFAARDEASEVKMLLRSSCVISLGCCILGCLPYKQMPARPELLLGRVRCCGRVFGKRSHE